MLVNLNKRSQSIDCNTVILILSILICQIQTICIGGLYGCAVCLSSTSCKICLPGRYLTSSGSCSACPSDCSTCSSLSICLTCVGGQNPYAVPPTPNKVCTCPAGTGVNIALNACLPCQTGCLQCLENDQQCTQCSQGFGYLFPTATCQNC